MSLDVFVACAASVALPSHLPADFTWKHWDTGSYTTEIVGQDWILEVWLIEDPKQLQQFALQANKKRVVGISLQGNDDAGFQRLEKTAETIMKNCEGVLLDF